MQGIGVSYVTTSEMSIHSLFYYTGPWNVVFSLKEEHQITKGNQLTTIPVLEKEWKVSFEFKANGYPATIQQVLHMTIGGKGTGSGAKYGDRTPAIWTHKTKGLLVASAVSGEVSYSEYFQPLPKIGEWISIEIAQEVEVSDTIYSITIAGEKVLSETNTNPSRFEKVKVFSSSSWYTAASGVIRNLVIKNKNSGKS